MKAAVELQRLVVAVGLDDAYAPRTATVLRSCVLANPSADIAFEVFHDGSLTPANRERLTESASSKRSSARFHAVPSAQLQGLPTTLHFGSAVWLRFFIPDLLTESLRAIYLDSDTLVMGELRELWETPLGSLPIAAVANVVEPPVRPRVRALGIEYPGGFFNSGVLVMDLAKMREEGATAALLDAAVASGENLLWPDQEILNLVFRNRWHRLHPRWNAQNSFWAWREWADEVFGSTATEEARNRPAVRHFEGPGLCKPWHFLCQYPGTDRYRAVMAQTPWASLPLEDRTAATRVIKHLPRTLRPRAYARLAGVRRRLRRSAVRNAGGTGTPGADAPDESPG
jgi:UDP-glucose/galactose:(glucosyl)LPS alpha-1,2-glucosyl/galactosyltransferase